LEIEDFALRAREELNNLPQAPSEDPLNEVTTMLHNFIRDLSRLVEGIPGEDGLLQAIRPSQNRFKYTIRSTAPQFIPFTRDQSSRKRLRVPGFLHAEEGKFAINNFDPDINESDTDDERGEDEEDSDDLPLDLRNRAQTGPIYIDEVSERAQQYVSVYLSD
jgi:hypothetical protein